MSENEAVEIAMARSMHDAARQRFGRCWEDLNDEECAAWRRAARLALTSHPAVDALREFCAMWDDDVIEHSVPENYSRAKCAVSIARTVLASLRNVSAMVDEQVQQALDARGGAS